MLDSPERVTFIGDRHTCNVCHKKTRGMLTVVSRLTGHVSCFRLCAGHLPLRDCGLCGCEIAPLFPPDPDNDGYWSLGVRLFEDRDTRKEIL